MHAVCLAAVALASVLLPGLPPAALAAADDEPRIEVASLKFEGVQSVDAGALRGALATRVSSRWPWGKKALFDRSRFQADLERIRAFYVDRGFPDARVTSFDVRFNQESTRVDLTITVSEGEPLRVTEITFQNVEGVPPARLQAVRRAGAVKEGKPFDRAAVAVMREAVINELRDQGYPFARVGVQTELGVDPHTVSVTFVARTGRKAYFGPTEVSGAFGVSDNLIRRELLYKEGDLYRRSVVQDSQRKLYELELFQFVTIRPDRGDQRPAAPGQPGAPGEAARLGDRRGGEDDQGAGEADASPPLPVPASPTQALPRLTAPPAPDPPRRVPMRVTVTESKHRRVQFAGGYGTEDKARVEGRFRQLNFLGGARTAGISGKWSSLDRGVRAEFTNPYFFSNRWSVQLNGERWYEDEPAYYSVVSGGHATFTYRPRLNTSFSFTFSDVYQSSEISNAALEDLEVRSELIALGLDPTTGGQDGTLNAVAFDFRRTTTANLLNPTRGYLLAFHLERAGRWVRGSYAYSNASFEVRHYLPLGSRIVLATRAQAGSLKPDDDLNTNIPFSKRYFLGGSTSLRGWGRFELSPLSGSGLPVGGFSMFEASIEARTWFTRSLGAVAFLDLGNVWIDPWRLRMNDLRYAVGPGLRYNTPVGPLRFDVGYQLNPVPGLLVSGKPETRRWRVHFSIGQAF